MDFIRIWPEGSKPRSNFKHLADELNHASARKYRYLVADFCPSGDRRFAYTTVLCYDGTGYMQILGADLYLAVIEAKKECEYESVIDRYFNNPDCPDVRYKYSLF